MREAELIKTKIDKDDWERIVEQFNLDLEKMIYEHNGNVSVRYSINLTDQE